MKKEISPAIAIASISVIVLIAGLLLWKGTQKKFALPDKPPSGPMIQPPSQQGRIMPRGNFSSGSLGTNSQAAH